MSEASRVQVCEGVELAAPSEGVAWVILNRPGHRNAMHPDAGEQLTALFEQLAEDERVRAIVLSGEGGYFSAGGDVDAIRSLLDWPPERIEEKFATSFRASLLMRAMPKPVIGALAGGVVGGAVGLALACDIRFGSPDVFFMAPFNRMGLVPDRGASWLLPTTIGASAALDLALSGRRVESAESLRLGLISRVVSDPVAEALDLARQLCTMPSSAVAQTKRLAHRAHATEFATGVAAEVAAQVAAFGDPQGRTALDRYVSAVGSRVEQRKS